MEDLRTSASCDLRARMRVRSRERCSCSSLSPAPPPPPRPPELLLLRPRSLHVCACEQHACNDHLSVSHMTACWLLSQTRQAPVAYTAGVTGLGKPSNDAVTHVKCTLDAVDMSACHADVA